jgi:hypothetical protein
MTGHKSLTEVRTELEAVLGAGPTGGGHVAESLRRFLTARAKGGDSQKSSPRKTPPKTPRRGGPAKRRR